MKFNFNKFITAAFFLIGIVVATIIVKSYGLFNIIYFYKNFDIYLVTGYFFITLVIYATLTWRWHTIIKSMGKRISFKKLFFYKIIGNAVNFFSIGPKVAGSTTQTTLLQNHHIKATKGTSTIMIDKMIEMTTSGILFIVGLFFVSLTYAIPEDTGLFMALGGLIFVAIIGLFYYRMLNNKHFYLHIFEFFKLHKVKNKLIKSIGKDIRETEIIMIKFYQHDNKTFIKALAISFLSWIAMFIEYKMLATLLGMNLGFVELFFIITFVGIAVLFPIPMSLGVLEAGQVSAFSIVNLSASAGIALAFLVRVKDILWGVIGMGLLAVYGFSIKSLKRNKSVHS